MVGFVVSFRTAAGWLLVTAVLAFSIGVAVGGGYSVHQADAVIEAQKTRYEALRNEFDRVVSQNQELQACIAIGRQDQHLQVQLVKPQ